MKRIKFIFVALICFCFIVLITSCSSKGNNEVLGTYYLYEKETYNKEVYIILEKNTWKDDDNAKGDYKISGETITFYVELFGSKEELYSGTIKDGVMKITILGKVSYYCKEGKTPFQNNSDHTHNYSTEWTIDKEATCTVAGSKSHHCLECNEKKDIKTIPALGHNYGEWTTTKEPTETTQGTKERVCSVCKYKETDIIPLTTHTHSYGKWQVIKEPTFDDEGKIKRICSEDVSHFEEFNLPVLNEDNYELIVFNNATCLEDGSGTYIYSKDNQKFEFSSSIPKLGHQYEVTNTTATCTTAGNTTYVCKNDSSHTYTVTGKALGHDYIKEETKKVTCTEDGLNTYICSHDSSHTYTEVVYAEHKFQDGICSICNKKCDFKYEKLSDKTCKLTEYIGSLGNSWSTGVEIVIPSYIDGYKVVELEEGILNGSFVSKLVLPFAGLNQNPTTREECFIGSLFGTEPVRGITPVRLLKNPNSNSLDYINYYLPSIHLKEVVVKDGDIPDDWLNCIEKLKITKISISPNTKRIGNNAFSNVKLLDFIIPNKIEEIGNSAFDSVFNQLVQGTIPNVEFNFPSTLTKIGNGAFTGNTFLKKVNFEEGLLRIGDAAFSGCGLNQELIIPESVTYIGNGAFKSANLSSITIKGSVSLGDRVFYQSSVKEFNAKSITNIGSETFAYCGNLEIFSVENSKGIIGERAFAYCSKLKTLELPNGIKEIQTNAFQECNLLTKIIVPDSVEKIGADAFYGCINLEELTLPFVGGSKNATVASKETLFGYIFHSVDRGDGVISVGQKYNGTQQVLYYIPENLSKVTITGGNILYGAFSNCKNLTEITISKSVIGIGNNAFEGCTKLSSVYYEGTIENWCNITFKNEYSNPMYYASQFYLRNSNNEWEEVLSIEIPEGVVGIGNYQFYGFNNVTSVTIPNSLTSIDNNAFEGCTKLSNVYYEGTIENWCKLKFIDVTSNPMHYANHFYQRNSNNEWEEVTNIEIPEGVVGIGNYQFYGFNSVTSITIPNSVTSIDNNAFEECTKLSNVYYEGTIENWCKLKFIDVTSNPMHYANHFYQRNSNNEWEEVTNIEIPEGVVGIGNYQFYGFNSVTSITIPNSVTSIESEAFSGCDSLLYNEYDNGCYLGNDANQYMVFIKVKNISLTSCKIKENTRIIISSAFSGCNGIIKATIPTIAISSIPRVKLQEVVIMGGESIPERAFYNFSGLRSLTIGNSVISIGNEAFYNCSGLTSVTIGNSIKNIGEYAFNFCQNLKSITIENSVTSIGMGAFDGCFYLESIYYQGIIKDWCEIEFVNDKSNPMWYASHFYLRNSNNDWEEVTNIDVPEGVTKIGKCQFWGFNNVTSIELPSSVTSIGDGAFLGSKLARFVIPDSVTSLGSSAFYNCKNLTSVIIGNSVTSIGDYAFYGCSSLRSLTIGNSVTSIGNEAFSNCSSLQYNGYDNGYYLGNSENPYIILIKAKNTSITSCEIHKNTKLIYSSAFSNCRSLTSLTIGNSVTSIGSEAFSGCYSLLYNEYDNGYYLGNSENPYIILIKAKNTSITSCEIHKNTKLIYPSAFRGYSSLTSIVIPDSVTRIENYTFYGCSSLTSIVIPDSVTSIGKAAFDECYSLVEVYNLSNLTITTGSSDNGYIGYYAKVIHTSLEEPSRLIEKDNYVFYKDENNKYYLVSYKGTEKELVLPNDIEGNTYEINRYAFRYCRSLTSITIPNSVTRIGNYTFDGCRSLTSVYYEGTSTEWNAVSIGSYNSCLTSATRYYYSETQPTEAGSYWHYLDGVVTKWE